MKIEKRKISAKIVADSVDNRGNRITTFILTYPRFIHSELLTHRLFSRNAASSRAIPFNKIVKDIEEDPFIPIAWQKDHKGMQGVEYLDKEKSSNAASNWYKAALQACETAKIIHSNYFDDNDSRVTKQLCNRLLEPFQWYTCLVTATEFDNFFELRAPKYKLIGLGGKPAKSRKEWLNKMQFSSALHPSQYPKSEEEWWVLSESGAEIHIQALAEAMWDAQNESTPNNLKANEWHIPFNDKINDNNLREIFTEKYYEDSLKLNLSITKTLTLKVSTARCARLSYMTFDGEIDYDKDIKLHDTLLESKHFSPFEHCCKCMSDEEYYTFIKGKTVLGGIEEGYGIINYEYYPYIFDNQKSEYFVGKPGPNPNNGDRYGWCNNVKGFIPYRHILENE